ncbi:MAG: cysteine desulfurase [Prosthecobacter sp.]|uniref:cysteine desulfurase n=1 Tax=Prosthecobacter sp. TaxID=1965333 RepID=UPI00262F1DA7|nr:cysteine desulfurase [Prosthecobacter sp.]MCF7789293.1 cysteine desulfurase [Prosthecobacter sp.]
MDWHRIRSDFPILDQQVNGHPLVYLDNAASSQKPRAVIQTLSHYYERDNSNVHRALHELSNRATEAFEAARKKAAHFIGAASEDEIIFTRGTTEGINLVANTWGTQNLRAGDVILITGMEHHSNLIPWQMLAQRTGAILKYIPVLDDGTLDSAAVETLLTEQVKLFAFVHISNSLGTINPAKELIAKAKALGAVTLLDGAQSAGHMPIDVRDLGCDFFVFSGHKMCGPTGIGVLYGRMALLETMPPWHGGGEMILSVTMEGSTYKAPPHRFEAGTPNIAGVIGLGAAMDYLQAIGLENIQRHDHNLANYAVQRMSEVPGIRILGPQNGHRGALAAFHLDFAHPHDLVEFANSHGVAMRGGHHCTQPLMKRFKVPGTTRASFYFYNMIEEINRLVEVLLLARKFFT